MNGNKCGWKQLLIIIKEVMYDKRRYRCLSQMVRYGERETEEDGRKPVKCFTGLFLEKIFKIPLEINF